MERREPAIWWASEVEKLERSAGGNRICVDVILDFLGERGRKIRSDEVPKGEKSVPMKVGFVTLADE